MPPCVLVAEDDERLAALVATALAGAGYEVAVVHDGYAAVALVAGRRFDALLTDLSMPGLTGDSVARLARASHPGLPVLLMTASERLGSGRVPWFAVIRKPDEVHDLLAAVAGAVAPAPTP